MNQRNRNGFALKIPIAASGNTMLEYSLIGLSALVCIAGFSLIGSNWNSQLQQLKQDMLSHKQAAANTRAIQQAQMTQQAQIASSQAQIQQSLLTNTPSINSTGGNSTIETVGANGSTAAYAADILTNAKKALDSGKLTQDEYNIVAKLANKGHDIAMLQGLLEDAFIQSKGNSSAYANSQFLLNGLSYTPAQLNTLLETTISDFSALRSQASVQNGVLYDPELLNSINDSGILIINNGYSTQQQNQTAASFIQYQNEGLGGGSAETHQQSAVICTEGKHLDSGNHCVP
jgi:hypothetical protein